MIINQTREKWSHKLLLPNISGNKIDIFTFFSQRARLLDNTERLERSGRHLEEGYKMCVETGKKICYIFKFFTWNRSKESAL